MITHTLQRHPLAVVLVLAAVVRLGVLLAFPSVFAFDQTGQVHGSEAYDTYAQNLLATGVYGRTPGTPDAAIPPLYAYALAGVYAVFGRGYVQVGLFHIALDLVSIACVYVIASRLLSRSALAAWRVPAAGLAALAYTFYPYLVFQNLTLIDTPFFMALLHGFVCAVVLLRDAERGWFGWALTAGVLLGLATLTRPILPLFVLLVAVWFLMRRSLVQTVVRLAPVALVTAALLCVWIVRNYGVYGEFVPMSITAGSNFYQGNNADVIPYMRAGYDAQWTGPDALTSDPYSPAGDRERSALAWAYLRAHPDQVPTLLWVKFAAHWSIDVFPYRNPTAGVVPRLDYAGNAVEGRDADGNVTLGALPPGDAVTVYSTSLFDTVGRWLHRVYFGALLALAVVGVVVTRRAWRDVALLWFVQVSATVVYVVFHPSTRYRSPTDPLLFVLSAAALVWAWERWRARRNTH